MPRRRPPRAGSACRPARRSAPTRSRARGTANGCARRRRPCGKPNHADRRATSGVSMHSWAAWGSRHPGPRRPQPPQLPRQPPRRRFSFSALLDGFFFVFAGLAAIWLAWLLFTESFSFGWWGILGFVLFWALLAYLVLPRLHRILTTIYVPDYFIGRARTSDGLLGDPVNLAVLGDEQRLHAAMAAAGWTRADEITAASSWRIITSTVTRRSYDEAPVSPLFLFGRQQDAAYQQEVAGNPAKRHHVRFWRCPDGWLLPGGSRVDWLAAGTFDRAVGFSLFTLAGHAQDRRRDRHRARPHRGDPARVAPRRRRGGAGGLRDRLPLAQRRRRHDRHRRRPAGGRRARRLRARRRIRRRIRRRTGAASDAASQRGRA